MATKRATRTEIDWYLISIDRLKQIGLILLLIVLGLAGWWFFSNQKRNPRSSAEAAIADAREALNSLASSKDFSNHRSDFDRAQKKLDEATALMTAARYANAQETAVESQTISRAAMSGEGISDFDAQFTTIEGEVQFQKSSTSEGAPTSASRCSTATGSRPATTLRPSSSSRMERSIPSDRTRSSRSTPR